MTTFDLAVVRNGNGAGPMLAAMRLSKAREAT